jgi:hypothetical protein
LEKQESLRKTGCLRKLSTDEATFGKTVILNMIQDPLFLISRVSDSRILYRMLCPFFVSDVVAPSVNGIAIPILLDADQRSPPKMYPHT